VITITEVNMKLYHKKSGKEIEPGGIEVVQGMFHMTDLGDQSNDFFDHLSHIRFLKGGGLRCM
jgi:hypothetical protein